MKDSWRPKRPGPASDRDSHWQAQVPYGRGLNSTLPMTLKYTSCSNIKQCPMARCRTHMRPPTLRCLTLLYPSIAVGSVRLLAPCHSICSDSGQGGEGCIGCLRADCSIPCGTGKHAVFKAFAGLSFAVFRIFCLLDPNVHCYII